MPISSLAICAALAVSTAQTPSPTESVLQAPDLHVGDSWVFDQTNERGTSHFRQRRVDLRIESLDSDDMMVVGIKEDGSPTDYEDHIGGRDWSLRRLIDGRQTMTGRPLAFPLSVGKTWVSDYTDPNRHGSQTSATFHTDYKAVGWEDVTTPAGVFHALKIESNGTGKGTFAASVGVVSGAMASAGDTTTVTHTQAAQTHVAYETTHGAFYYVPKVRAVVKSVEDDYNSEGVRTSNETRVLVSYKLGS